MTNITDKQNVGIKASQIPLLIEAGIFSKEGLGLKEKDIKKIYAKAKTLYDSGKYKEAQGLFSMLCLLEPNTPSFRYGLASSAMMLNDLDLAIECFLTYAGLVKTDPNPYFYLSICYEKKNDLLSTLISLKTLVSIVGNQPHYQALKNRALMVISHYSKKVKDATDATT